MNPHALWCWAGVFALILSTGSGLGAETLKPGIELTAEKSGSLTTYTVAETLKQGGASGVVLVVRYRDTGHDSFAVQVWDRKTKAFADAKVLAKNATGTDLVLAVPLPGLVDFRLDDLGDGAENFSAISVDYVPLDAWALFSTGYYAVDNAYQEQASPGPVLAVGEFRLAEFEARAPFAGVWLPLEATAGSRVKFRLFELLADGNWTAVTPEFATVVKAGASVHTYPFLPQGAGRYRVQAEVLKGTVQWKLAPGQSGQPDVQPQYLQKSVRDGQ